MCVVVQQFAKIPVYVKVFDKFTKQNSKIFNQKFKCQPKDTKININGASETWVAVWSSYFLLFFYLNQFCYVSAYVVIVTGARLVLTKQSDLLKCACMCLVEEVGYYILVIDSAIWTL